MTILLHLMALAPMALGKGAFMYQLVADAADYAMSELGFEKGDVNVLALIDAKTSALTEKYGTRVTGIFIRWDSSSNTSDGLVLGFDFDNARNMSNAYIWPSWAYRVKEDLVLMDSADTPEDFVSTIKEFHLDNNDELLALQAAGVNPLKVLGVET